MLDFFDPFSGPTWRVHTQDSCWFDTVRHMNHSNQHLSFGRITTRLVQKSSTLLQPKRKKVISNLQISPLELPEMIWLRCPELLNTLQAFLNLKDAWNSLCPSNLRMRAMNTNAWLTLEHIHLRLFTNTWRHRSYLQNQSRDSAIESMNPILNVLKLQMELACVWNLTSQYLHLVKMAHRTEAAALDWHMMEKNYPSSFFSCKN
jgi:hypothetical protein